MTQTPKRKFAIAGNVGETVFFWTGLKLRAWSIMESRAKTWSGRTTAETWIPTAKHRILSVGAGRAVKNLRVLEVAP